MSWESKRFGEVRNMHEVIAFKLNLSTEAFLFWTEYFGLSAGQSILERWKNENGSRKYSLLLPEEASVKDYPCKTEGDGKAVAFLVGNLFRLDARHPYKEGQGHDLFRTGNKPLAYFTPSSPPYSELACYLLCDFWFKRSTLGPISKEISCASTVVAVDIVFDKKWKM